jgi:hypothetical protein
VPIERGFEHDKSTYPDELKDFYSMSYGAFLGEYEILTPPEIKNLLSELRWAYGENWRDSVLPFAYVRGIGDVITFGASFTD